MEKILLINKPLGWTSFDVVAKIRSGLKAQGFGRVKVGHAGTLDPFATGLLIVLLGDATKKQLEFMKLDKEYEAVLELGKTSTTGDPEGEIKQLPNNKVQIPNEEQIIKVIKMFIGEIEQIPPKYSAIKIDGKRAYELARKNIDFEIKPRKVVIYNLEIKKFAYPSLELKIKCSSGTYIRTLAEDIGRNLGTGAFLTDLKRTKIGKHELKDAVSVEEVFNKSIRFNDN